MANYDSWMVTEKTFAVKDPEAFKRELRASEVSEADSCGYDGLCYEQEPDGRFWLGGYNASLSTWDSEKDAEIDIIPIIQKHIKDGEVAIFMSIGQEKLRFVDGFVTVVTNEKTEHGDLHSLAEMLVRKITPRNQRILNKLKHGKDIVIE